MTFLVLGARSLANMAGLHPTLIAVVKRAIVLSTQDFGVQEPQVRTLADQKKKVASGASQTLKSNHLQQVDLSGRTKQLYGHAIDLVPWVDGAWSWDWARIFPIAAAMSKAAAEQGLSRSICWGGVWDRWMGDYPGDAAAMQHAEQAYCVRHPGRDFVDGPHFQIFKLG